MSVWWEIDLHCEACDTEVTELVAYGRTEICPRCEGDVFDEMKARTDERQQETYRSD